MKIVVKFGGTSLATVKDIKNVVKMIGELSKKNQLVIVCSAIDGITDELIHKLSKKFEGKIMQKPPIFSALKREGKRLYQHAREGTKIEIKSLFF